MCGFYELYQSRFISTMYGRSKTYNSFQCCKENNNTIVLLIAFESNGCNMQCTKGYYCSLYNDDCFTIFPYINSIHASTRSTKEEHWI